MTWRSVAWARLIRTRVTGCLTLCDFGIRPGSVPVQARAQVLYKSPFFYPIGLAASGRNLGGFAWQGLPAPTILVGHIGGRGLGRMGGQRLRGPLYKGRAFTEIPCCLLGAIGRP